MAAVIGKDGIHKVIGQICDLCGLECEGEKEELNALDCTYLDCNEEASVYHQDCVEKYLRSVRLEKNRKTGYRCPRGASKHSAFAGAPCPGRAKPAEPAPPQQRPFKGKGKAAAETYKGRAADAKVPVSPRGKPVQAKAKPKAAEGQIKHLAGPTLRVNLQEPATKAKPAAKPQNAQKAATPSDKDQMKETVYKTKLELGLKASPPSGKVQKAATAASAAPLVAPSAAVSADHHIMKVEEPTQAARPIRTVAAQPAVTAWQRSSNLADLVRSYSPAPTASDAGSLRSETPRSLPADAGTPPHQQLHSSGQAVVKDVPAGSKDGQIPAAASPITPNAIKAFQPDELPDNPCDFNMPLASATGPLDSLAEDCHQSSFDGRSICSDDVSDALFFMDPGTDSDVDKLGMALQEPAFSTGLVKSIAFSGPQEESEHTSDAKPVSSPGGSGEADRAVTSSPISESSNFAGKLVAAQREQQFLQALGRQRAVAHAVKYQQLGFSQLQAVAAVNMYGDDAPAALRWLLSKELAQEKVPHRVATLDISDELECLGLWQQTNFLPKVDLQDIVIRANSSIPGTPRIVQRHAHHLHAPEIELSTELRPHEGMVSSSRQQTGLGSIASLQGWPQQYGAGSEICAVPCLQDWHHQTCSNGSLG